MSSFGPKFIMVNQGLTGLNKRLDFAIAAHDSNAVAVLQAQKEAAMEQLVSVAPAIFSELSIISELCNNADNGFDIRMSFRGGREREILAQDRQNERRTCDEELKPLISSADYIRQNLLNNEPLSNQTEEDKRQALIMTRAIGGESLPYTQIHSTALYLFGLLPKLPR